MAKFSRTNSLTGFFTSAIIFYVLNWLFPVDGLGEQDEVDIYGTFTQKEAERLGVVPLDPNVVDGEIFKTHSLARTHKEDKE